jgi:hypothetical protein
MDTVKYDFCGIELLVEFNYTAGVEAYVSGLPENCYPAEDAECELESITSCGNEVETDDIYMSVKGQSVWLNTIICDYICENITDILGNDYEA